LKQEKTTLVKHACFHYNIDSSEERESITPKNILPDSGDNGSFITYGTES